ncbi:hypothetical protein [Lentzea waywayandensis]|uniref:hypothetical protein n=1 Tax=Lentzea waywayandensis TaxID=84724 RepID=UPI0011603ABC|nr:hypothetical protein [Lentzea waywayandensis]
MNSDELPTTAGARLRRPVPAEVAPKLAEVAEVLRGMLDRPANCAPCTPSPGSSAPICRRPCRPT